MTPNQIHAPSAGAPEQRSDNAGLLRVKLKDYFHPDCGDAYNFAWAADRLHFGIRIENMADDEGNMCVEVTLYNEVPALDCRDVAAWWPFPRGWATRPEVPLTDDELWDALHDPRWEAEHARAFMLRVTHDSACCPVARPAHAVTRDEWFVDFSGLPLAGDLDYTSFPHTELLSSGRAV